MKSTLDGAPVPYSCTTEFRRGQDVSRDVLVSQSFTRSGVTPKRQNRNSGLGAVREAAARTRLALGAEAGVAESTVWRAERAAGTLATFESLASTMGMAISGTALPPGVDLPARLLALRTRRGLGRRRTVAWGATDAHRWRMGATFAAQNIPPISLVRNRGRGA